MKIMKRNSKTIYFKEYKGEKPVIDENGYETGEPEIEYGRLKDLRVTKGTGFGRAQIDTFGTLTPYEHVLVTDDMTCKINPNSIVYIDVDPHKSSHTHVVRYVLDTLNVKAILVREVNVSE